MDNPAMNISHPFGPEATVHSVLMNSPLEIVVGTNPSLAKAAFSYMEKLVKKLNYYSPTSELHRLNTAQKETWQVISKELWEVLQLSKELEIQTKGLFSILFEGIRKHPNQTHIFELQAPNLVKLGMYSEINLGGIGKGFILDKTAKWLEDNHENVYLINAGGDIRASSTSYPWKIGLVNPINTDQTFGTIKIKNGALVTSGTYNRKREVNGKLYSQFYNPLKKIFIESPSYLSVTAQGPTAALSEVWAKCILMGFDGNIPAEYRFITVHSETLAVNTINATYKSFTF